MNMCCRLSGLVKRMTRAGLWSRLCTSQATQRSASAPALPERSLGNCSLLRARVAQTVASYAGSVWEQNQTTCRKQQPQKHRRHLLFLTSFHEREARARSTIGENRRLKREFEGCLAPCRRRSFDLSHNSWRELRGSLGRRRGASRERRKSKEWSAWLLQLLQLQQTPYDCLTSSSARSCLSLRRLLLRNDDSNGRRRLEAAAAAKRAFAMDSKHTYEHHEHAQPIRQ